MAKDSASISIVTEPADGEAFTIGETVRFEIKGTGVISYACARDDGDVVLGGGLMRGDTDFVVGESQNWHADSDDQLACTASLIELVRGRTKVLATTTFEVRR